MEQVRSLRELFASMSDAPGHAGAAADPHTVLGAAGHEALPGDLVAEALVNYADAAPLEIAQHLAPFVMAHSAVPGVADTANWSGDGPDAADGFALLFSAPHPADAGVDDVLDHGAHPQHHLIEPVDDALHHDLDQAAGLHHTGTDHTGTDHTGTDHTGTDHTGTDHGFSFGHEVLGHDPEDLDFGYGQGGGHLPTGSHDLADLYGAPHHEANLYEAGLHEAGLYWPAEHHLDADGVVEDVDTWMHEHDAQAVEELHDAHQVVHPLPLDDAPVHDLPLDPGHGV